MKTNKMGGRQSTKWEDKRNWLFRNNERVEQSGVVVVCVLFSKKVYYTEPSVGK